MIVREACTVNIILALASASVSDYASSLAPVLLPLMPLSLPNRLKNTYDD